MNDSHELRKGAYQTVVFALLLGLSLLGQAVTKNWYLVPVALVASTAGLLLSAIYDWEYTRTVCTLEYEDRSHFACFGSAVTTQFLWVWAIILIFVVLPYRGWNSFRQWVYETKEDISHTLGG